MALPRPWLVLLAFVLGCGSGGVVDAGVDLGGVDTGAVDLGADLGTPIDAGDTDAPPDAGDLDAGPIDAGSGPPPLPLGTATVDVPAVGCSGGAIPGAHCESLVVSCPGVEDAHVLLAISSPGGTVQGTVVGHAGGAGMSFYSMNLARYLGAGFRVVQMEWTDSGGWEATASASGSILAAACRPATVFQWIYDNLHTGGVANAFCAAGHSGGNGAISYALAHYGLESIIDYAALSAGPPFGRLDYGCGAPAPTPRRLCPSMTFDAPVALPMIIDTWEHTTTCNASPSTADIAKWAADSVVSPTADYAYPHTEVAFWNCVDMATANGTTAGTFFYSRLITSAHSVTCETACAGEDLGTPGWTALGDALLAGCTPRHSP